MTKYNLCAPNGGDTMTVSGGGGWSSPVNDRGKGGGDGGSKGNGGKTAKTDFGKNPEKQATVSPYLAIALPMPVYPVAGTWGFTLNLSVIDAGLGKVAGLLADALPVAGRLVGFTAGALFPSSIAPDSLDPTYGKIQQNLMNQVARQGLLEQGYNVTAMPAGIVSDIPVSEIGKAPTAAVGLLAESVVNVERNVTQLALIQPRVTTTIPVVKAKETKVPGIYSVNVIPGKPALQVKIDMTRPAVVKNPPKVNEKPDLSAFLATPSSDTHHAFVDFGGGREPVYVSVSKKLTNEQEKQQIEEAQKREQEWLKKHPEIVAERALSETRRTIAITEQAKEIAIATIDVKTEAIPFLEEQTSTAKKFHEDFYNPRKGLLDSNMQSGPGYYIYLSLREEMYRRYYRYTNLNNALERDRVMLAQAQADLAKVSQQLTENNILAEQQEKDLENKQKEAQTKTPELKFDDKIKGQMGVRGWTEADVKDIVAKGAKGRSEDKRSPEKTPPDFLGRNDPATVYGGPGKHVIVNDRTGEVVQVSDKTDKDWVDDSRIAWEKKNEEK
ncbi:hypothetical protein J5069_02920 [Candidatus Symbiopectobacterium sp. NZEC127]|uniref:colicin-like bacteriocin tRNase domain-containing protein n=1 Tax=Candidatus Symbiopectobacterium sp. NZEC127 TaxID=2820472 RepID=UPI002227E734|nr:colicin-like bacteriocin tRNase domain-containing protein [Candidatus Symbiopectobacterium sp. NZEC127]MCW2484843.1 hypothetical protein [Candidatus Symbiopectobacterium sp. NZEC127]